MFMSPVYFLYGLAFFSMGLLVFAETRRASNLPISRELPWLAAFGLLHGIVEWLDMFIMSGSLPAWVNGLRIARSLLMPVSVLLLVRFGTGLLHQAGPLPVWVGFLPAVLLVPGGLLVAYALVLILTVNPLSTGADVWSRYLLYLPANLLVAAGFLRLRKHLPSNAQSRARNQMAGAAGAFLVNAVAAGLIVPPAPYGLAQWINYETLLALTGVPVQIWRMLSAIAVTIFVVRGLSMLEDLRRARMARLARETQQARQEALLGQQAARRTAEQWTDALVSLSRRIADMQDVDVTLLQVVDTARRLLHADTAALALWAEDRQALILKCFATADGACWDGQRLVQTDLLINAVRAGFPSRYPEDYLVLNQPWYCPVIGREICSTALVPLNMSGQSAGGLWVGRIDAYSFSVADLIGLESLADQAVIALEHALLSARLQSLAVFSERERIAREMHDSLAQILGYLGLEMQVMQSIVEQGDLKALLEEIDKTRLNIEAAHADVRENILSLRTTLSGETELIAALKDYISEFSLQSGVEARLVCDLEVMPPLSPLAAAQLVRIVQEALTNVRKHACARAAEVRLFAEEGVLRVTVTDDGVGFDGLSRRLHFGLQTMRERAESVGGGLTVNSQPNAGTQVELWLPLVR